MRRLLQFGTWILLMVTFLTPVSECLDRWDKPGIANDTEFALFTLIVSLALVLLLCRLISAMYFAVGLRVLRWLMADPGRALASVEKSGTPVMPPLIVPLPLRI